jgi:hypothetical protein
VHATTRRVGFIASLDTRTSRVLFILWEWANKMTLVKMPIDSENYDVYNGFFRTAFWATIGRSFVCKSVISVLWANRSYPTFELRHRFCAFLNRMTASLTGG